MKDPRKYQELGETNLIRTYNINMSPAFDDDQRFLYKYLNIEKVERLMSGNICLTPPKYLNDPWDFYIRSAEPSEETLRQLFEKFYNEQKSAIKLPFASVTAFDVLPKEDLWQEMRKAWLSKDFRDKEPSDWRVGSPFGVISLSADPLNRLMWTHYTDNKGIVIGFHTGKMAEIEGLLAKATSIGIAFRAIYATDTNEILASDFSNGPRLLLRKHTSWLYENEWRIVRLQTEALPIPDEPGFIGFPVRPIMLGHIIFGMNIDLELKARFKEWLQSDHSLVIERAQIDTATQAFLTVSET